MNTPTLRMWADRFQHLRVLVHAPTLSTEDRDLRRGPGKYQSRPEHVLVSCKVYAAFISKDFADGAACSHSLFLASGSVACKLTAVATFRDSPSAALLRNANNGTQITLS